MLDGTYSRIEEQVIAEQTVRTSENKRALAHALIADCLNGGGMTDGQISVRCRVAK
jgi:hypothetical protein